jgi:putative nucleotidyltransferase with HDIG domain
MNDSKLNDILSQSDSLPSIPGAAVKLLSLLDNPESSVNEIEEILKYDPGLTANVLKLSNSAYFGLPQKIGSVKQAILVMGTKRLTQLVMASCVHALMDRPVDGYELSRGEFWRHSVAVSVSAELLVKELQIPSVDVIFTAALLHDVGKIIMDKFVKEEYKLIHDEVQKGLSFELAEQKVLGTNHAEIGAKILRKWSFPDEIVLAVRHHHEPDAADPKSSLADIVHIANVLCLMIGIGIGKEGLQYQPSELATQRLGLNQDQLEIVASQTLQWVDELSDVFGCH